MICDEQVVPAGAKPVQWFKEQVCLQVGFMNRRLFKA